MSEDFEMRGPQLWPDADYDFRMEGRGLNFHGYAAVFNVPSQPIPGPRGAFVETIHPGAFNDTLARNPDIALRTMHNMVMLPLARTKSGTMTVKADTHGLLSTGTLPDNEAGHIVRDAIKRGDVDGMSMTFRVPSKAGEKWNAAWTQRDLLSVQLGPELSIVDFPVYTDTTISVRRLAEIAEVEPDALAEAFDALRAEDKLTPEQQRLLQTAINAKAETPFVSPTVAKAREQLAALAAKR